MSLITRPGRFRERGFTLVEVLIAIVITSVVSLAIYSLYTTFFKQSQIEDLKVEAQQNARVSLNMLERELMNAGYAAGTADVITDATSSLIEFIYTDPETDTSLSLTAGKRLKVKYWLQTTGGVQYLVKKTDNLSDATTGSTEQVAPYVNSITFTYYDLDGAEIADTSTQPDRNSVKFVTVNMVTRTKSNIGSTGAPATFTLETHIRLRNIGLGQVANDSDAPAGPTGIQVRDPGLCGRLKVKWTKNAEGDVLGYKIYYGVSSGSYEGVVNVPTTILSGSNYTCSDTGSDYECTMAPGLPTLSYSPSDGSSTTTYYVAVKAYDNSLNHSDFSSEVYGNPAGSNSVFDAGSDDSTLNPVKPSAVTGFSGANGSSDGQVAISWTAYDTTNNPDVIGFRVYRSESPFSDYPLDPATQTEVEWIAGETGSGKPTILSQTATSFTDTGLTGCQTYYYAIAPVKCDTTLISDSGGDSDEEKYVQDDYDATCGDGSTACSAGTGFASVTGSDTAPNDSTAPSAPSISANAGWKRVAVSLTQPPVSPPPDEPEVSHTCVYVNESATYPELLTDTDTYPLASGCYQVNTSMTPDARLIPDSGGVFTVAELQRSQSTSFWHDSMTLENPGPPALADTGTYSYRAVAFNLCSRGSAPTGAQDTTILCDEDPPSGEKPPAVTSASVSCCSTPVSLAWTQVPSDTSNPLGSTPDNPFDLAGYRIFRSTSADFSASTMISGVAPYWGSSFNDTTASEGTTYYYRIVTTDCPYEKMNPSEATIRANMISGYLNSVLLGPVMPGSIIRDEKCPGAGGCTKDDHRAVLTGVDIDSSTGSGNGSSSVTSAQRHNTVTMFLNNTSSGTMTITGATVYWVNSSAYLREIKIGGGRSGMGTITTSLAAGLTASGGSSPYTRVVSNASLASSTVPAGARYVPMTFTFKDASDSYVDMRDDQLLITLQVTNDSTGVSSCVSYLTVSLSSEGISVPFGPSITATQQNKPSSPTFGYAVPGSTGLNTVPSGSDGEVVVDSGATVTVSASIAGNTTDASTGSKVAVSSATLYYKTTVKTTTTAPASGYTAVAMTNTGGNIWSADIPASDGYRVWYYIVAVDNDGNWDRDPEIDYGAYVYDQMDFDVCDVTPSAPANLTSTGGAASALLSWDAVTTYTSGASIDASDSITYRIFRNGTQQGSDQAGLTYTDTVATGVYSYTVKALNSCSTEERLSSASNTAATCVGSTSQATLSVSPTSIYRGDSFDVTIVDCLAMRNDAPYTYGTTIETINTTAGFTGFKTTSLAPDEYAPTITETGAATGTFNKTITTTSDVTDSGKLLTLTTDTISVYYPYASPTTKTISVVVDPCTNTPKAPTGLSGSVTGQNVTLSWTAVTQNTDNSAITDLAGYRVYEKVCAKNKPNCTGSDIVADWFLRTTADSGSTSVIVEGDQGNLNQRIYYFKLTAYDTCGTPEESGYSNEWNETN
ncbi:MAG: hypothetical protein A2V21_302850 [Deltaproteobacteria bacterium GWC2_55_46]|nr:MAG: hypothetical protein A2Z79_05810 [Deltaproteobacteria bacterium GWA2_55_82]OGQ62383.1 MAG: hypothetical protein A3I81_01235 [Deltaproteobacteria bacterium RIFCSPLOWO2_02_FULL_55_12]OIJ73295.1 MAG: hypothetical protein A2V21_302850 [Deltaproteobacteria bacterium GWC2_55_46]